jgi:tetratricopeptide (TPR) repeat protein
VRGELDWIVMKALEKDRTRRYETANGLARDIQHYLADEPVEACPPSAGYRLRKLARKYKRSLAAAAVFAALLLAGVVASTWQAVRATRAELATRAERDRALAAEKQADAEKASAQATLRFLLADVLEYAGPEREANRDLTVRALLDKATDRLGENTELPLLTEAAIRHSVGRIYYSLGEFKKSEPQLTRAYELQRRHAGDNAPDTLDAAFHLALLYRTQNDFLKAEPLFLRALEGKRRLYGDDHRDTLEAVDGLAYFYNSRGESDRAERLYVPALEAGLRAHGDRDPVTLRLMFNLGTVYSTMGHLDRAEPLMVRALKGQQAVLKDKHPAFLSGRTRLANVLLRSNRLPEAEREARESFEERRVVHGEMHPLTLTSQALLVSL